MGYNRFYLSLVLHCILLAATAYLFFYFLIVRQQASTAAGIALLSLVLISRLIYLVNRSNRILASYLTYLHEKDPTLYHTKGHVDRNFKGLHENLEMLIHEFKENRINIEVQAHYLEAILDNVSTGIICFNDRGEIRTMNRTAGELLQSDLLKQISDLDRTHAKLGSKLYSLSSREEFTCSHQRGDAEIQLIFQGSRIKLKGEIFHIISLNDITHQMEEQEISSWKKLIRVINHEIMNSMTPIITLATAIRKKVTGGSPPHLEDAVQSATIIEERSNALVGFIERYKELTSLPPPIYEVFKANDLFEQIGNLYREELGKKGIKLRFPSECKHELEADRQMMEQVLINLVKNAVEALRETPDPEIVLLCHEIESRLLIAVKDNGEGIDPDKLERVFVPFFSTREDGSGIGLSLCRQIIHLHGGRVSVESNPGLGTEFSILL